VVGIASINITPGIFHAIDFVLIGKLAEESLFEFGRNRAGNNARNIHIRIAGAGETKIDNADDFIIFIEKNIAKIKIAVNEILLFSRFDILMILVDMVIVMLVIEFF